MENLTAKETSHPLEETRHILFSTAIDQTQIGTIADISEDGLIILGIISAKVGDCITLALGEQEETVGTIVEKDSNQFSVKHDLSLAQTNFLNENVAHSIVSSLGKNLVEKRRFDRKDPGENVNVTICGQNEEVACAIKDISETGIAFISQSRLPIGEVVRLGFLYGVVYRHTEDGFVICLIAAKQAA